MHSGHSKSKPNKTLTAVLAILIVLALEDRMQADTLNLIRLAVNATFAYSALYIITMIGGLFRDVILASRNDMSIYRAFLVLYDFLGSAAYSFLGCGFSLIGWATINTRKLPRS